MNGLPTTIYDNLAKEKETELDTIYKFRKFLFSKISTSSNTKVIARFCYLRFLDFNNMLSIKIIDNKAIYKLIIHNNLSVDIEFSDEGKDFSIIKDNEVIYFVKLADPYRFML